MASIPILLPAADAQRKLRDLGGDSAARCYQCATCSSVCELAPDDSPFPRRQMLWAQWGMVDRLAADPALWLCHQCNDCTARCPRDARPGDVLQSLRALVIERLAFPSFLGKLVGAARKTWPLLLGLPILFWVVLLGLTGHLSVPADLEAGWAYDVFVPHSYLYAVFFPVAAWVVIASWVGGHRLWSLMGAVQSRDRGFIGGLLPVLSDIGVHSRFSSCSAARPRRIAHLLLMWGFVGAAITSGLLIVAIYIQHLPMPLALTHPYKLLGNLSAGLLVVGGAMLVGNRFDRAISGVSRAFDVFFLGVVVLVIATGMVVELARLADAAALAMTTYIVHLGAIMTLFVTFPYSKFAHMLYRTVAMAHARAMSPTRHD